MRHTFKDTRGKTLNRPKVEEIALGNIMSSMGHQDLAQHYLDNLSSGELLQWATDDKGNFPK